MQGCKAENETQQHVLQECKEIHKDDETKVKPSDYFSDIQTLIEPTPGSQFSIAVFT